MPTLRDYQQTLYAAVRSHWDAGNQVVCMVLPTGGGKTVIIGQAVLDARCPTLVIAHRHELVSQLSLALCHSGVPHDVIASQAVYRQIAAAQTQRFNRTFLVPGAPVRVASIDTIRKRLDRLGPWLNTVGFWVVDEGHHVVRDNKWGDVIDVLPERARGLLPSATPIRLDGKGLGRHHDGFADAIALGPTMAWLMERGHLTRYRPVGVESHIEEYLGAVAASGDWSQKALTEASVKSEIAGSFVDSYRKFADGKIGITFTTDVQTAERAAKAYVDAGIPAAVLTGNTQVLARAQLIADLEARRLMQLCVVDVVSEGFDLPAIEVGIDGRPTASLSLYLQKFGRVLRPNPGKDEAIWIDHVGNFLRHGPPDKHREWTLDRREKRAKTPELDPYRRCLNEDCLHMYPKFLAACPRCGTPKPAPETRGPPKQVEGVLRYFDDETLARLRGEQLAVAEHPRVYEDRMVASGLSGIVARRNASKHADRLDALAALNSSMKQWGGYQRRNGLNDQEMQELFFQTFGVSAAEAAVLKEKDALALNERVIGKFGHG